MEKDTKIYDEIKKDGLVLEFCIPTSKDPMFPLSTAIYINQNKKKYILIPKPDVRIQDQMNDSGMNVPYLRCRLRRIPLFNNSSLITHRNSIANEEKIIFSGYETGYSIGIVHRESNFIRRYNLYCNIEFCLKYDSATIRPLQLVFDNYTDPKIEENGSVLYKTNRKEELLTLLNGLQKYCEYSKFNNVYNTTRFSDSSLPSELVLHDAYAYQEEKLPSLIYPMDALSNFFDDFCVTDC